MAQSISRSASQDHRSVPVRHLLLSNHQEVSTLSVSCQPFCNNPMFARVQLGCSRSIRSRLLLCHGSAIVGMHQTSRKLQIGFCSPAIELAVYSSRFRHKIKNHGLTSSTVISDDSAYIKMLDTTPHACTMIQINRKRKLSHRFDDKVTKVRDKDSVINVLKYAPAFNMTRIRKVERSINSYPARRPTVSMHSHQYPYERCVVMPEEVWIWSCGSDFAFRTCRTKNAATLHPKESWCWNCTFPTTILPASSTFTESSSIEIFFPYAFTTYFVPCPCNSGALRPTNSHSTYGYKSYFPPQNFLSLTPRDNKTTTPTLMASSEQLHLSNVKIAILANSHSHTVSCFAGELLEPTRPP
ncbi:hypothetical protein MRB53_040597 [Persea americana]|nr:hypothetical protein MRB53_040597 [Persea americana]